MGIYRVKSKTCNCKGTWSTLDPRDLRIYLDNPCKEHSLIEGNTIYYELNHLLDKILKDPILIVIKQKYPVKIVKVKNCAGSKILLKIEVNHNGELDTHNFYDNKQIYYLQMDDELMWKKIDDNTIQLIILYLPQHHTVEEFWEPNDY